MLILLKDLALTGSLSQYSPRFRASSSFGSFLTQMTARFRTLQPSYSDFLLRSGRMESDISFSLCTDQTLVKGKQCLVNFIHIIVSPFDKIFYNDVKFT